MKICILCFDLSNNSLGRAGLLALALAPKYEVEIVGTSRNGNIWPPMKELEIPIRKYTWKRYPFFISTINKMVKEIDADVLLASKLRATSFGISLIKKWYSNTPVILDIDDWELGFLYHSGFWGKVGRFFNFSNPNGLFYTWLMERLTGYADAIVVSNRFLKEKFSVSGPLVPHCRDTNILDPAKFDSESIKENLGLKGKRVVMFLGTPRPHKGTGELLSAIEKIKDPDIQLAIIGADPSVKLEIDKMTSNQNQVKIFPKIPFKKLPDHLSAADILVIPQRDTTDTQGQIPAKLFDAMSMAKPIITTPLCDIPEVLDGHGYLIEPGDSDQLAKTIMYIFENPEEARQKGLKARKRCQKFYDIKEVEKVFTQKIKNVTQQKNCFRK